MSGQLLPKSARATRFEFPEEDELVQLLAPTVSKTVTRHAARTPSRRCLNARTPWHVTLLLPRIAEHSLARSEPNSGGLHSPHTRGVARSIPAAPTTTAPAKFGSREAVGSGSSFGLLK